MLKFDEIVKLEISLKNSIQWIKASSNDQVSQNFSLLKEFKHSFYKTRKLKNIFKNRPAAGVFGASQSGKSYFVSSLARNN
jgi:hypothetical protein